MLVKKLVVVLLVILAVAGKAQDQLHALGGNAVLINAVKNNKANAQKAQSVTAAYLPFADDFSYFGPYPDPARWVNSTSVFVNHSKATKPITIGVATFDGLNAGGYPYNPALSSGSFDSDTLTSIPLRLDSLNGLNIIPSDSVTLRFYYQAKGFWEAPDNNDDLLLDFYNPTTGNWTNVWVKGGYNPGTDSLFHRVMIAITDTAYLKNGFQFRFRNFSTACGDVDHWHIDAVYMDKKLNPARDTIVEEVSFSYDLGSLLKNYSQMPYKQFTGLSDMKTNVNVFNNLRDNYSGPPGGVNTTTYYQIRNNQGSIIVQNTNGSSNIPLFGVGGYCSDASMVNPSLNGFVYNNGIPLTDSTSYLNKFYTKFPSDNYRTNDTIYYRQKFHNYFAYDDGSAEAGYGFAANGGVTAVKYTLNVPDTLRAIDVFFDPVFSVSQLQNANIRLYVFPDNGGLPGAPLYIDSLCFPHPLYNQSGFDYFQRYQLTKPVTFTTATIFYVGIWQQLNISLNIGYDLNNDSHNNIFFNVGSGWNTSSFKGSLMVHPVFGDSLRAVGVQDYSPVTAKEKVLVYPNPANGDVFVSSATAVTKLMLCDLLGNIILEENGTHLNISAIPQGMYLIKTFTSKGFSDTQKLIIAR